MHKGEVRFMSEMYDIIEKLCAEHGVNITKMCREINIPRSVFSELKAGRTKTLSGKYITSVAEYFGVTTDYLLGNEEKPAIQKDDELIKEDPFAEQLFAAYGEVKEEFSQEDIDDIKMFMEMVAERKRKKKEKEK